MSGSETIKEGNTSYTAQVAQETDLASPVTVTGGGYTVTFSGNNFETKHLRRIRRNSVSDLKDIQKGPGKLAEYATQAKEAAVVRWNGKESSTNSRVYLDLGEYCKFGAQVIGVVKDDNIQWEPWGNNQVLQKHARITLGKCLAYSHSGIGGAKKTDTGKVQGGVGMELDVTIQQITPTSVSVCHYAGGDVKGKFKNEYINKKDQKSSSIAKSIVN